MGNTSMRAMRTGRKSRHASCGIPSAAPHAPSDSRFRNERRDEADSLEWSAARVKRFGIESTRAEGGRLAERMDRVQQSDNIFGRRLVNRRRAGYSAPAYSR